MHNVAIARSVLMLGGPMGLLFLTLLANLYTVARTCLSSDEVEPHIGGLVLLFGGDALNWSWLLASCIFPVFWTEWKRMMIRRKLPIAQWPKQLYL